MSTNDEQTNHKQTDDEKRYADYLAQQEQRNTPGDTSDNPQDPLEQVRQIRAEQLAACDLQKHKEMAQMRKQLKNQKNKP